MANVPPATKEKRREMMAQRMYEDQAVVNLTAKEYDFLLKFLDTHGRPWEDFQANLTTILKEARRRCE